jgi:hypothetical protein
LQLDGINCNSFDPLQLPIGFETIATRRDLVATRCEPIATRVGLVATEKKSIEFRVGAFCIENAPTLISIEQNYIYSVYS